MAPTVEDPPLAVAQQTSMASAKGSESTKADTELEALPRTFIEDEMRKGGSPVEMEKMAKEFYR